MADVPLQSVLDRLRLALRPEVDATVPDAELLRRFVARRDPAAFELLFWRHAPLVAGVCRRVLRHCQDTEDAFQGTFLILAQKAGSIGKGEAVGGWLYQVAFRAALKARARRQRQRLREGPLADVAERGGDDLNRIESRSLLDQAIQQLPEKYRTPFILHYLEGKSVADLAAELGLPRRTALSRLFRARQRLRRWLGRRGLDLPSRKRAVLLPSAGLLAAPVLRTTVSAALSLAAGSSRNARAGATTAGKLAEEVLRDMALTRIKALAALLLGAVLLLSGAGVLWQRSFAAPAASGEISVHNTQPPAPAKLQPKVTPDAVSPPLGAWKQSDTKKVNLVRFEPKRMAQFSGGKLRFLRISYKGGKIFSHDMGGGRQTLDSFEVNGDVLTLTSSKGEKHTFTRLAQEPPELSIPPLKIAAAVPLPADQVKKIKKELAQREAANIKVRMEWSALKNDPAKQKAKLDEMLKIDADDTAFLIDLVKEVGWIDAQRFGDSAANSAYLIAMHTHNLSLMQGAVREIEKEAKAKRFDAENFAGFFDRYRLITGRPERYGMHTFVNDKGQLSVGPLEDRKRVDQFRKEIGLPPLAEYLKRYEEQNGGQPVLIVDD